MAADDHDDDARWMARALELAAQAEGRTRPNPLVGCVIVRQGEVLAEGYHRRAGERHAETAALSQLEPGQARGATVYVNLEPCSHYGRTPPCSAALVEHDVARVVVAMIDPDPRVSGRGVNQLRDAGIVVDVGLLEEEARALNAPFIKRICCGLPWVVGKWAMSLDGKIATRSGRSSWISGELARQRVHGLRDRLDAILVGSGTLRLDDPRLTCRIEGGRDPVRVVLDASMSCAPASRVVREAGHSDAPTWVVTSTEAAAAHRAQVASWDGVELIALEAAADGRFDIEEVLRALAARDIMSVLVEGGAELLGSLRDEELLDEVWCFVAPKILGGAGAPTPMSGQGVSEVERGLALSSPSIETLGDDVLIHGRVVPERRRHTASTGD